MLCLSRHTDERIRLTVPGHLLKSGHSLQMDVVLLSIRSLSRARLGFEGPREIQVDRAEVLDDEHLADGRLGP